MWFFHLADKNVSWNVSLFWTLSIFFFSFRAYWEEQKLIQHHIIAGSDEVRGWGSYSLWWLSDRLRGSALILTMLADVKALRLGAVKWHAFTPVVQYLLVFQKMKHSCVNYPYPIMHPAMTRFPMIWMSVFSGKTHCSYFIDIACLLKCWPHVCFKSQPLPFSARSCVQKCIAQ